MIHHSLENPIDGFIDVRFLQDMNSEFADKIKASVIAISTYPGHALTLVCLITEEGNAKGSLFAYLPFDAFSTKKESNLIPYGSVVYHDCPSGKVDISSIKHLQKEVKAYLKREDLWINGEYICTIDWFERNDLLHLILMDNGQLAALPSHKVKFGKGSLEEFPNFKKLHEEWHI